MKINRYEDISQIDREAKKDYIDRHSAFVHCESSATKGKKFAVKVKVGDQYSHPDDFDHYISWVQLWDGERMLAKAALNMRRSIVCSLALFVGLFSPPFGIMVACTYFLMYDKAGMEEVVPAPLQAQFKDIFNTEK